MMFGKRWLSRNYDSYDKWRRKNLPPQRQILFLWSRFVWPSRTLRPLVDSRFAPSQWETALLCNDVSHWLGANQESALYWRPDDTNSSWAHFTNGLRAHNWNFNFCFLFFCLNIDTSDPNRSRWCTRDVYVSYKINTYFHKIIFHNL